MATTHQSLEAPIPLPGIKYIISIGSGKGGVGKSTITANLALALQKTGAKVGLLDADIHGPSIPRLFGCLHQHPNFNENQKIEPLVRYGIKLMSIGFLVEETTAIIWRGPMLFKALDQFFNDVEWGELDYLLIDLPPGTGDVQLTMAQKVPVNGALVVTTPQNMSLSDVKKAVDMFEKMNIPIIGVIENMAYLITLGQKEKIQLFPKGELNQYLDEHKIKKIVELPFYPTLAITSEAGIPILESDPKGDEAKVFSQMAALIRDQLKI